MKPELSIIPLTPAWRELYAAASEADGGHHAPLASQVFLRAGEVVGAAALAPCMTFWAHSQKLHARESLAFHAEVQARCDALGTYLAACAPDSPFHPLMARLGYRRLGNADIFQRA